MLKERKSFLNWINWKEWLKILKDKIKWVIKHLLYLQKLIINKSIQYILSANTNIINTIHNKNYNLLIQFIIDNLQILFHYIIIIINNITENINLFIHQLINQTLLFEDNIFNMLKIISKTKVNRPLHHNQVMMKINK
jgi:hypothetical protein